uniref:Uncharacterized protein n=1 Tax=Anguilla anguilla TaxID=7936 RepID=A0A0E9UQG1_ANGAN
MYLETQKTSPFSCGRCGFPCSVPWTDPDSQDLSHRQNNKMFTHYDVQTYVCMHVCIYEQYVYM